MSLGGGKKRDIGNEVGVRLVRFSTNLRKSNRIFPDVSSNQESTEHHTVDASARSQASHLEGQKFLEGSLLHVERAGFAL